MRESDLPIFRSPLLPDEDIRFEGETNDGGELDHRLLCAGNCVVGYVRDGVASLTAPHQNSFDGEAGETARTENWVGRNWDRWTKGADYKSRGILRLIDREFAERLGETDGLVLEIAAGPGAGFTPGVLLANRDARVLLNDVSIGILRLQREYIRRENVGPNAMLAAWDATERVLRPETVAAVSSLVGFCSTPNPDMAVGAAFEALVPGGRVFMAEVARGTGEIDALPKWIKEKYKKQLLGSWTDDLEGMGFQVENHEVVPGDLMTDADDGGLPKDVIEGGHTLHYTFDYIVARKPG